MLQKDFRVPQGRLYQLVHGCLRPDLWRFIHQGKLNHYYFIAKLYVQQTCLLHRSWVLPSYHRPPGHQYHTSTVHEWVVTVVLLIVLIVLTDFLYCRLVMRYCAMYSKATTTIHAPTHFPGAYLVALVTYLSFHLYLSSLLYVCKSLSYYYT